MKRIIFGLLLIVILILSGCGGVEVYENINMEVTEYARIPPEIMQGYEETDDDYRFVVLKVSGSPSDHFYGGNAMGLIEIIDEGTQNMCVPTPLEGWQDDVLVKDTIYLKLLINCPNKDAKKSTFIFYQAPSKVVSEIAEELDMYKGQLETVAAKKVISISGELSEEDLALVKNNVEEWKETRKRIEQENEQRRKEEEESLKQQKALIELGKQFEPKYDECRWADPKDPKAMDVCIEIEKESSDAFTHEKFGEEKATEWCQSLAMDKYCSILIIRELFDNSADCKDAIPNEYWWDCDDAFK